MAYQIQKQIPQNIFRTYDIRGTVEDSFTEDNVYTLGVALGSEIIDRGLNAVNVGRDGRLSGPQLIKALIAGITSTGCHVTDIGEVTTPMLYYAAATSETQSGIMLSGSHNPPNYNGLKIIIAGETLYGPAITNLYHRIIQRNYHTGSGICITKDITDSYFQAITGNVRLHRPIKVVIDCGNGIGGKFAPPLFRALGCEVEELFCNVDGNFPNHQPDPSIPKNLAILQATVQSKGYEIGLAFDGDADRVGIVTEQGMIISADRLLILLANDLLTRHNDKPIIFDIKCSRQVKQQIEKHHGIPLCYRTGHSLIKAKMKETGAYLAGELSGHIFMKERWFGFDDGIYVAARILELLAQQKQTVTELFRDIPCTYATPELKIPVSEEEKFELIQTLIAKSSFPEGEINIIDGLRIDFSDGFGLIRASNTTPYLIACFEGDNQSSLERIQTVFKQELSRVLPTLKLPF